MNSTRELLHQLADPDLSKNEQAQLRCKVAKEFQRAGDHEAAREAMGELWRRVGERPDVEGLDHDARGNVLLRAGALTGWIGGAKQISGAQETAKNLLTESIGVFEALEQPSRLAEAQIELAYCYWREGALDEARIILAGALARVGDNNIELRAVGLLASAIVERAANRYNDALRFQTHAAPLFEDLESHSLRGSFHNVFANVLENLGRTEQRADYIDRALIEYAAASYHFEQARHERYAACVENNLGFLFSYIGRFKDAHEHIDHAQTLMTRLKDDVHLAQVDDTRARVLLAEGRAVEAEKAARRAVRALEKGDAQSLLGEALTTHGTALARLNHLGQARLAFERAISVAEQAGDTQGAGLAALTLVEELSQHLTNNDLCITVDRAAKLLSDSREIATVRRLAETACWVLSVVRNCLELPPTVEWTKFSFPDAVRRYEAHFIKLALKDAGGRITRAARLLGFNRHQSLISLLKRHKDIPVTRRKRSIIRAKNAAVKPLTNSNTAVKILHVEDYEVVAGLAKEMLEAQGWQVETCADGNVALEKISGKAKYDLLLVDWDLPGVNGLELVSRARKLAHRSHTPIIVLSGTPLEAAAREAGADVFLQKPQDVSSLVETIIGLLKEREGDLGNS